MNMKLVGGIFCLATGFLAPLGAGLIALYIWDEFKGLNKKEETYINSYYKNTLEEMR